MGLFLTTIAGYSNENLSSIIYNSDNFGETWKEAYRFPNVVSDFFYVNNTAFLIGRDQDGIFKLFKETAKQNLWDAIPLEFPMYSAIFHTQALYYTSTNDSSSNKINVLVKYRPESSDIQTFDLAKDFDCHLLSVSDQDIRLIGKQNGHIVVYSLSKEESVKFEHTYSKETDLFPQGYYAKGNTVLIVVGNRNAIGVTNKILRSDDSGKHWITIEFEIDDYIKPFYFLDDPNMIKGWFYSGLGKFQILN